MSSQTPALRSGWVFFIDDGPLCSIIFTLSKQGSNANTYIVRITFVDMRAWNGVWLIAALKKQ